MRTPSRRRALGRDGNDKGARHRRGVATLVLATMVGACGSGANGAERFDATVTRVVDGDTIVVRFPDGKTDRVRILGVDTPETHKPGTPVQCYGPDAERFTRARLSNRVVSLELDKVSRDRYQRLLAYVYVDGKLFEDELISKGLARVMIIAPNRRHAKRMIAAEVEAKSNDVGLWGNCPISASN